MYCVIQEIQRKKANPYGHHRELEAYSYTINGRLKYAYRHTGARFERPIGTAYKVSIHESRRVDGVVTKRQFAVTTVGYYDLVEYWIGDCITPGRLKAVAAALCVEEESLWALIYAKIEPLRARIRAEFEQTEECKTHALHEEILEKYRTLKAAFSVAYGVDADQYDCCFDVFGNVVNQAYLDEIMAASKQRKRSYQKTSGSNYTGYDYTRILGAASSTYSDEDKGRLKQFYRSLSKLYHPDVNQDTDTHAEMVLLNRLKEEWGI